jgi:glycosyltransferase involved in cell wall biosynthesis
MVLPVRFYRSSPGQFSTESAFCAHLRLLRQQIGPEFERLVVAAPAMSRAEYDRQRNYLATVIEQDERIFFVPLAARDSGPLRYWLRDLVPTMLRLNREIASAAVVHAGPSHVYEPREIVALALGVVRGRKTICVVDIDERRSAWMNYFTGRWSRKTYLLNHYVLDALFSLQLRAAARWCSLLLLKGKALVDDYGRGKPNIKNFLDTAYSAAHIIPADTLQKKLRLLQDRANPLELVYFGRLTAYKGVDKTVEALAIAVAQAGRVFRLHIIGPGEEEANLKRLVHERGLDDVVEFHGAVPFGPGLFERLYGCHVLLATPLAEDTPRSALDAMAAGVPLLAFDTEYYRTLAESGAVSVTPWPQPDAFAAKLIELERDRASLAILAERAVAFARENTQERWLERRAQWTREYCFADDAAS